jgi:hypothetical protein
MASSLESENATALNTSDPPPPGWVKLGVVAAASVLAGAWRLLGGTEKPSQSCVKPKKKRIIHILGFLRTTLRTGSV